MFIGKCPHNSEPMKMTKMEKMKNEMSEKQEYSNICKQCSKQHTLFTQRDEYPEYYTTVIVKCDCRNLVEFELPVN